VDYLEEHTIFAATVLLFNRTKTHIMILREIAIYNLPLIPSLQDQNYSSMTASAIKTIASEIIFIIYLALLGSRQ
jgi:hypothetical protein